MLKITDEFSKQLQQEVVKIEKKSTVEIVPVFVSRSASYLSYRFAVAFLVAFVAIAIDLSFEILGGQTAWPTIFWSLACGLIAFAFLSVPAVLRFFLPRALMFYEAEEEAQKSFLKHEVFATRERTGLMIFISEFEHFVLILADKGLGAKIKSDRFAELGLQLAGDFSKRRPGLTFIAALESMEDELAQHFPPHQGDNPNELADHLRRK